MGMDSDIVDSCLRHLLGEWNVREDVEDNAGSMKCPLLFILICSLVFGTVLTVTVLTTNVPCMTTRTGLGANGRIVSVTVEGYQSRWSQIVGGYCYFDSS